jgi:hypothetical protein
MQHMPLFNVSFIYNQPVYVVYTQKMGAVVSIRTRLWAGMYRLVQGNGQAVFFLLKIWTDSGAYATFYSLDIRFFTEGLSA